MGGQESADIVLQSGEGASGLWGKTDSENVE